MKRIKMKDPVSEKKLIRVHFVMFLMRFCEPFRRRIVLLTTKTVAAEGILSFVSPLSRSPGYPPYRILRRFTQQATAVLNEKGARDQTRPWEGKTLHQHRTEMSLCILDAYNEATKEYLEGTDKRENELFNMLCFPLEELEHLAIDKVK